MWKKTCDSLACGSGATSLFSPHFDVICDLLLNTRTATWNVLVTTNNINRLQASPLQDKQTASKHSIRLIDRKQALYKINSPQ